MGNVTAKTSGDIASFMTPSETNITSLKVHFSPKQLGTGDPSPENVREIVGWDGVEVNGCGKNIAHIIGYSATTPASSDPSLRRISNNYGTTISTTDFSLPDTKIIVTQSSYTTEYDSISYRNGYFTIIVDNLDFTKRYNVSFNVDDVTSNPLNVDLSRIRALSPAGTGFQQPVKIDGNRLFFKNVPFTPHSNYPNRKSFEIRNAGMSFTLSEFMVTPVDDENFEYEPYQGTIDTTNWSSDIGTVYGGYVDLISGELKNTYGIYTFEENGDYEYRAGSVTYVIPTVLDMKIGDFYTDQYVVCDRAKKVLNRTTTVNNELQIKIGNNNNRAYLYNTVGTIGIDNETDFRQWIKDNPISFTYPLLEPVVYQLTPTQLQSFVGQNNFWSNADYVEVEYDLIETIDIQKAKQKIILNQPQLKTISDKVISFNTDMVAPMKNCKIYFNPIQLGTGDPSPTNVRNINGWTGIDSYVNGDKISVDWTSDAGTVYGGYLDLAKGEVVAEYDTVDLGTLTCAVENDEAKTYSLILPSATTYQEKDEPSNLYCSSLTPLETVKTIGLIRSMGFNNIAKRAQNTSRLYVRSELDTADAVKTSLAGYIVAYKLATPIHYPLSSLTSQQLLTLKSTNHIWSETNGQQIDVKYWTHKNLTSIPLTDYLENQTWTDSAYISSSGKKTTNTVSASHFLTNQILLEAGTYVLSGFSHYVGTDNTNYKIHAYDSTGKWLRQITFQQIGNLSPVDISFTLDTDTYVNISIAMDFDGVLTKIN